MAKASAFKPEDFSGLVHEYLGVVLSGYGFKVDDKTPHNIMYESANMLVGFAFGREEVHATLEPLPTAENDDPDYVGLPALFVFLELSKPSDTLFQKVNSQGQLQANLEQCRGLLPKIEDYLCGRIVDYGPIWERIDARNLLIS